MDSQKKGPARLNLPMSQWLSNTRSDDTLIAWCKGKQWRLNDLRRDVAGLVEQINVTPQQRWALCFDESYAFTVALLAVLYCARTPILPGHCRQAVLQEQRAEFDALLTDQPLELSCPVLRFPVDSTSNLAAVKQILPEWQPGLFLVLFTSGSTGAPQKVIKPVVCLEQEACWLAERWGSEPSHSRLVSTVAHHHMYGLTFSVMMPLFLGIPFYSHRIEYHEQLVDIAHEHDVVLISSPAFLQRLDLHLPAVHCQNVFSAGGPLSYDAVQHTQRCCGVLPTEIYGTTETGVIGQRQQSQRESPWNRFEGVTFAADDKGNVSVLSELIPQPEGIVLSDNIALSADQRHFQLGARKDRVVKIAEQRISLSDIESRLQCLESLNDVSVLIFNKQGRDYIAAVIVLSDAGQQQCQEQGKAAFLGALRQQLRQWLTPVAIPRFWRIADAIPVNAQGKRAYAEIQELFL